MSGVPFELCRAAAVARPLEAAVRVVAQGTPMSARLILHLQRASLLKCTGHAELVIDGEDNRPMAVVVISGSLRRGVADYRTRAHTTELTGQYWTLEGEPVCGVFATDESFAVLCPETGTKPANLQVAIVPTRSSLSAPPRRDK
jgi:hypothetical protein